MAASVLVPRSTPVSLHLIAAAEPDAGHAIEQLGHGIRRRLFARDPDVHRLGAERAEVGGLFVAACLAVFACLGEDGDLGVAPAAGEVDELLDERRRLRSAADDHQRAARVRRDWACEGGRGEQRGARAPRKSGGEYAWTIE